MELTATTANTVDLILAEEVHMRRLARRMARCEADADDLVQDTLLRAFRARSRFQPGTSIRAWMTTILRRVFLTDAIRTRRRGLETDTDSGEHLAEVAASARTAPCEEPALDSVLDRVDDPVKRAVMQVPSVYLTPFLLATIHDLSCAEIARHLAVPEGTVMSRIHRARERLKQELVYPRRPSAAPAASGAHPNLRVVGGRRRDEPQQRTAAG
jgi:RNA polymerase sigma-70 factor (ECF subfamily)